MSTTKIQTYLGPSKLTMTISYLKNVMEYSQTNPLYKSIVRQHIHLHTVFINKKIL